MLVDPTLRPVLFAGPQLNQLDESVLSFSQLVHQKLIQSLEVPIN